MASNTMNAMCGDEFENPAMNGRAEVRRPYGTNDVRPVGTPDFRPVIHDWVLEMSGR